MILTDERKAECSTLQEWISSRREDQWTGPVSNQALRVRDEFHPILVPEPKIQRETNPALVVSTHISKSQPLPVYYIEVPGHAEIFMRGNFYDWKISIAANEPVRDCFFNLFGHASHKLIESPVYFEGFDREWVFKSFAEDQQKFSLMLPYYRDWPFTTFAFLLSQSFKTDD